jgi:2',3'-cyclic-nucleotide 2'-phosphodiesterase
MREQTIRIMCLGDVVGRPGRIVLKQHLSNLRNEHDIDFVVVNCENSSGGLGIVREIAEEISSFGVDIVTLGDHTWQRKEVRNFLETSSDWCIRPANFPEGCPGKGWTVVSSKEGIEIGVINLLGRVFIGGALDCPFRKVQEILEGPLSNCRIVVCDLHAEATSEKVAMGRFLDGRISFLFGTHSHVQTSDNQILPGGTGYMTDLGMCGSSAGVLGMDTEVALTRFLTGIPSSYKIAKGSSVVSGAVAEIDVETGLAVSVERIFIK